MADTFTPGIAINRSFDLTKFDCGEGTLGVQERLFDTQFGTRRGADHGMFSELETFAQLTVCARNDDLLLYLGGTASLSGGLTGSIILLAGGTWQRENIHLSKGDIFITNPNDGVGTFLWEGVGW